MAGKEPGRRFASGADMRHSKDDARWIKEQLDRLPYRYRKQAEEGYSDAYQAAHDAEPVDHKKENAARRAANARLRKYVDKVLAMLEG